MPTAVDILAFTSMINTTYECFKVWNIFIIQHFSFYEQLKFHEQLNSMTSRPGFLAMRLLYVSLLHIWDTICCDNQKFA